MEDDDEETSTATTKQPTANTQMTASDFFNEED
jgi:hypothetical protein